MKSMTPLPVSCPHCGAVLKIRDRQLIGRRVKCPKCVRSFQLDLSAQTEPPATPPTVPVPSPQPTMWPDPAALTSNDLVGFPREATTKSVAAQLREQQQKQRKRILHTAMGSAVVLFLSGLVVLAVYHGFSKPAKVAHSPSRAPVDVKDGDATPSLPPARSTPNIDLSQENVQPIDLQYIPAGTRYVIHVRPADLWQPNSQGSEFRHCLAPLSTLVESKIRELSKREPSQIREALFCLIPGERGTVPELAAVFHLADAAKKSELLDQLSGRRVETEQGLYYVITPEKRAYFFPDLQTIAVCPAHLADEMIFAVEDRNPTSPGIQAVLTMTDRTRPVTLIFEPVSTRIEAELLLPQSALPLMEQTLDWLGPDVETVVWSMDLTTERLRNEVLIRNQGGESIRVLERRLRKQLDQLSSAMREFITRLQPREQGRQTLINRFPVMTQAFTQATQMAHDARTLKLETELPERAAPNLALAARLTWEESLRTPEKPSVLPTEPKLGKPEQIPLLTKLQRKITVEFRKTPLQVAFETIADEIQAKVVIDGDALKLSAYTKNMEQNFLLENVPAQEAIRKILTQPMYEQMCLVVDESKQVLLITTFPVAVEQGLKPYKFTE